MSSNPIREEFIRELSAHHNRLLAFITSLVGDYERANDVLQETHVEMWRKADDFQAGTNFFAWACTIARFKVLESRAKDRRDKLIFDDDLVQVLASQAEQHPAIVSDTSMALEECLENLSADHRKLIQERYAPGGSVKALAKRSGRTAQSLGVTLFRVRQALQQCIERKQAAIT